uniref:Atlastin-2 n=1 Tax=Phallusia mammillata TaxID=59560 RepID=A0A6F9D7N1_9ASCI|nr:atlastin-2 [Phallusia mammillata]
MVSMATFQSVEDCEDHLPKPVPIVFANENHQFELDEDAIASILLQNDVANVPVAVISVAGAFRKGKSFLLNFMLRYLSAEGKENWIGNGEDVLTGFSWRGGSDRDTTGIMMWSKVFKIKDLAGKEIALVLMDTQGAFDSSSTVKDCATIFALSTMTSSLQIYNISQNIQEDDLQHLELFTEYGRLAMEEFLEKPFQSLQFLVRDWSFPYEFPYGKDGGESLLNKRLEMTEKQHDELQRVRSHIRSCFTELSCYLMPHPGLPVATNPQFQGALNDINEEFKSCMLQLAPQLLASENIRIKQINGVNITCADLVEYFRSYIKIYSGEKLPQPKSMLQATAEANNLAAVSKSRDLYLQEMEKVCGSSCPFVNPTTLQDKHLEFQELALNLFDSTRKMGGVEFSSKYRDEVGQVINDAFTNFAKTNEAKNVFRNVRTPSVFIILIIVLYLASGLFNAIYFTSFGTICNLGLFACIASLGAWTYVTFTGDHQNIGQSLDFIADIIWENVSSFKYYLCSKTNLFCLSTVVVFSLFSDIAPWLGHWLKIALIILLFYIKVLDS